MLFLHERFTWVNAMGLVVLIGGVVLFNYWKWSRLRRGEIVPLRVPVSPGALKFTEEEGGYAAPGAFNGHHRVGSELELHRLEQPEVQQGVRPAERGSSLQGSPGPHLRHVSQEQQQQHVFLLHEDEEEEQPGQQQQQHLQPRSPRWQANGSAVHAPLHGDG